MTVQVPCEATNYPNVVCFAQKNRFVMVDTKEAYSCSVQMVELDNQVNVVRLHGNMVMGVGDAALERAMKQMLDNDKKKIVLNMEGVSYIDSAGLGALVRAHTAVGKSHGELKVAGLAKRVEDLLRMTHLLTVYDVFETEREAVREFGRAVEAPRPKASDLPMGPSPI